jgi:hypothetical protein
MEIIIKHQCGWYNFVHMSEKKKTGFAPKNESEQKYPEWVTGIRDYYLAYKRVRNYADEKLGVLNYEGDINIEINNKLRAAFYKFIDNVKEVLPEAIKYRNARPHKYLGLGGGITLGSGEDDTYYLPRTDEVLSVGEFLDNNYDRYRPDKPDFIGFDELRSDRNRPVNFHRLSHDPKQIGGELEIKDINTITRSIAQILQDKPESSKVEKYLDEEKIISSSRDEKLAEARKNLGEQLKLRIIRLVDGVLKYPDISKNIPKLISVGTVWGRDSQGGVVKGEKQLFFRKEEKDLVFIPVRKVKNWLGKEREEPDISNITEATAEDWLNTRSLPRNLLHMLPRKYGHYILE